MTTEEMQYQLKNLFISLVCVGITLLVPAALLLNGIAGTIRPTTLYEIYHTLPEDAQGFSQTERLDLALLTLTYLHHPEPAVTAVRFLESQRLPGTNQPLYNERELAHLVDVKRLTEEVSRWRARLTWLLGLSLLALLAWPLARERAANALHRGVFMSFFLLFVSIAFITLFWPLFFYSFHYWLFPPGSWSFAASDSLIRLFPEDFWTAYANLLLLQSMFWVFGLVFAASAISWSVRPAAPPRQRQQQAEPGEAESEQLRLQAATSAGLLTIEQFTYYSDLAATERPSECDKEDEDPFG
ncbi:MAG: DUF1461 domain-containing protein [Chloroflexi bacterium]|nr:DUF1461 domain-containing protein [Chloroflexota bacterium]